MIVARRAARPARVALGLILAPALPVLLLALPAMRHGQVVTALTHASFYAVFGYPVALLLGLPLHLMLARREIHGLGIYLALGGALGYLPCAVLFWTIDPSEWPGLLVVFVGYGASAALVFWAVAVRGARED